MQVKLGLKAFLKAVPESIGRDLRRKHFSNVREALEEARFLQRVQEEESVKEQVLSSTVEEKNPQNLVESTEDMFERLIGQLEKRGLLGAKEKTSFGWWQS